MREFRWILGGTVGAAAGIVIWVLVGCTTQYEVGWIAWGTGFAVGAGVRYGAYLSDQDHRLAQGIFASVISIGTIIAAKFILFSILVGGANDESLIGRADEIRFADEVMISQMANDLVEEMTERGQTVAWPAGMTYKDAFHKTDYPAAMWRQAELRWNELGLQKQEEQKRQLMGLAIAYYEEPAKPTFGTFFSPWDFLWFALAVITAFKIGIGTHGEVD